MKKDYLNSPILITGAARSGTSMIGGIIHLCGAFGGELAPAGKDVRKGMFENLAVLHQVVRPYLHEIGADPFCQYPLPNIQGLRIPVSFKQDVLNIFKGQGYTNGPWFYKGTAMNLIFPVWHYAFPNAKWVIVRRRDEHIVESCMHTSYMNAFSSMQNIQNVGAENTKDAWYWWVRQQNRNFSAMVEAGLNCKQVHPERMLTGDYSQVQEMLEWLGLPWNKEIIPFMEQKLGNAKKF